MLTTPNPRNTPPSPTNPTTPLATPLHRYTYRDSTGEVIYMTVAADTAEADEAYFRFVGSRVGEEGDSTTWCVVYDLGHERDLLGEESGEEMPEEMREELPEESGEESGESL